MHLGCCLTFGKRKNTLACIFLRFLKLSQRPVRMDHAILHGKPLSNPLVFCNLLGLIPEVED